jgi:hypothetical protein
MSRNFLTSINLNKNELLNAAIQSLAYEPNSPSIGQIYFDTAMNHLRQWDGTQWLEYLTAESGAGYITSVGSNLSVTDQQLDLGEKVVITDATQTLSNKTVDGAKVTGTTSFRDGSDTEYVKIEQSYTGTTRVTSVDDIAIRSTGGDVILYPGNDDGGPGRAYVHWGNDATGSNPQNEITTAGNTQTLTNKTIDNGIVTGTTSFRDASNNEGLTIDVSNIGTAHLIAADDLSLRATNDIVLYPGNDAGGGHTGKAYIHWGNDSTDAHPEREIATVGTSQTFDSKTLTNTTLGDDLDAASTYRVVNLLDPTNPQDAATKAYVDATAQGLSVLGSVRTATGVNIDITANASSPISGVTLANGDRVLVKAQDTATENGIYIYNSGSQTLVASTVPSDTGIKEGSYVLVEEGAYAAQGWIVTAFSAGASTWTQFSAAGEYTSGYGIDINGQVISVLLDSDSLSLSGDGLRVNYHTDGGLDNDSGLYVKTGTGVTIDNSGNVALDTNNGYGVRKVATNNSALTASGGQVTWVVTHNLGTQDVTVQLRDLATNALVEVDVVLTSSNAATLSWVSEDVNADSYRVVIVG